VGDALMGPVVEWVRRWLGVTQLEGRLRLLEVDHRRLTIEVEQLRANIAAAEKLALRSDDDVLGRVLAVLRRGR
jgi:hypothetical protein